MNQQYSGGILGIVCYKKDIHTMVFGVPPFRKHCKYSFDIYQEIRRKTSKTHFRDAGRKACYTGQSSLQRVKLRQIGRPWDGESTAHPFFGTDYKK